MQAISRGFVLVATIVTVWASETYAQPPGVVIDVDPLFDQAGTVVLGRIAGVGVLSEKRLPGPYGAMVTTEAIDLEVERCYKPPEGCGARLKFERRKDETNGFQPYLTKGNRIIAFLRESEGSLGPLNDSSIWPMDWLAAIGGSQGVTGKDLLETDLASGLSSNDPGLRFESMHCLQGFQRFTPEIEARLRNIVESHTTSLDERLIALATLLRDPKPEYVELVAKMAQTQAQAIALYTNAAREVGDALQWVKAPQALPSLVAIFESKVEAWHAPAMYAIRVIQDPKTIPLLIKALDDPDPKAEYHALAALALITHKGGDFGPGIGAFERDPSKYVHLWKQWWEAEGEADYGPALQSPKP